MPSPKYRLPHSYHILSGRSIVNGVLNFVSLHHISQLYSGNVQLYWLDDSTSICTLGDILGHDLTGVFANNLDTFSVYFPSWKLRNLPL